MSANSGSMLRSATSDDETSTEKESTSAELVGQTSRYPALPWLVFVFFLLVVWGVSLLPAVFFLMSYKDEDDSPKFNNQTHLVPHYPCNKPLKLNAHNICSVPCDWVYFTKSQDTAQFVVDNISLAISLLGFLFILLTWISIKQLRVFPHVIPLYFQGTSSSISLLVVISNAMGRQKSFCSHDLTEAAKNPTNFCVAQGLLIQYFSNVTAMWFVVYSICLVQTICSNSTLHRNRPTRIPHLISIACCCLLPWILVGIVFKEEGYGAVLNMRLCLPKNENLTYYTNTMITEICQAVGCSCLLFVVFKLYGLRNTKVLQGDQARRRKSRLDKVAIRLVCLMFAYAVITALVYTPICIQQRNKAELNKYLQEHFACLLFESDSSRCPKEKYQSVTYANTFIISYLGSALFTISTIAFLAFNKQSRRLWGFWWQRLVDCCCLPEEMPSADV